jgi:hypothetical protein
MSASERIGRNDLRELHAATTALRSALGIALGELLPPYADEVLDDLQDMTERGLVDSAKICVLLDEAAGAMEMLPSIPPEWDSVKGAAVAAGLIHN